MELLTIRAAGFTATVDACARDGGQLWFLSLLGSQQAVRALWARLVKGETAYMGEDELTGGSPFWLAREAWGTWRFYGGRGQSLAPERSGSRWRPQAKPPASPVCRSRMGSTSFAGAGGSQKTQRSTPTSP